MEHLKTIHIGADHAGFDLKEELILHLQKQHYEVVDHGAYDFEEEDDFNDFVMPVAHSMSSDPEARGIIIGGSGQGEAMVANRFPGVRAAVYYGGGDTSTNDLSIITASRHHNDANVLSLGARFMSVDEAIEAVDIWLETEFAGEEKYVRRISRLNELK